MTMRLWKAASMLALGLGGGCKDDGGDAADSEGVDPSDPDDDDGTPTTGTAGATSSPTTGGPPTPATDTTQGGGSDEPPPDPPIDFDLGVIPDAPGTQQQCTKVDFMFVIDNSGSMGPYQTNLVNNFPTFISGIQDSLEEVQSYQVGVITTDMYFANIAGCTTLSSLVVQTGGIQSSNSVCGPYADGYNFMTENDDLATTFSCAAQIGTGGDGIERPMEAVVAAVQKVDGDPGECNEMYLRDDALLVIVVITDEWDGPGDPELAGSAGDPQSWYDDVVAAKAGIPENIVPLVLTNYAGGDCPPPSLTEDGQNLVTWAQMFGKNGFVGGICSDYGPIFEEAIGVIDEACENFIPPD